MPLNNAMGKLSYLLKDKKEIRASKGKRERVGRDIRTSEEPHKVGLDEIAKRV
ncbi:MAG: hypothetical protein KatS3mg100_107 [Candidatus Parcubacteria bacterium]|nr:MAG: hypothetical protein KatS3mg100_107 [Candidatus Parcubacteria bacterium]